MIVPVQSGDGLLADVSAAEASPNRLHLWWLGQSGFLVSHAGHYLLLDPYLSDSLTHKYAGTDMPHQRRTDIVIEPQRLAFVAAVTASHHHTDHLDPDSLRPLMRAAPAARLIAPAAHRKLALERAGVSEDRLVEVNDGETVHVGGFFIEGVPAAHEAIERDRAGRMRYLGYVVTAGPFRIYHSGDTIPYDGLAGRVGPVDVALLPINGRDPARGVAGNLDAVEAARLAAELPAEITVPCHYEMFEFNTASPSAFADACNEIGVRHAILGAGERLTVRAPMAMTTGDP